MEYIHIRNLEKYHPGYKDRRLSWAKIYFDMVQGDPDCELIENEIDWSRLVKMILLELEARKPLPNLEVYWIKKGFDIKKRPMSLTLQMLHNFLETVTQISKDCVIDKDKDKDKDTVTVTENKTKFLDFVFLTPKEHEALKDKLGAQTETWIKKLNDYIGSKGKKYKSHYHTICMWVDKERTTNLTGFKKP